MNTTFSIPVGESSVTVNGSTLVVGDPGSGRRAVLGHALADAPGPLVVLDATGDLRARIEHDPDREPAVVAPTSGTVTWNLFTGVPDEARLETVARATFPDPDAGFFHRAARQVFAATLKYLYREGERCGLEPDNRELVEFFQRFSSEGVYELMSEHDDLAGALTAMNPEASKQATGVWATVQQHVTDVFVGEFGRSDGDWSMADHLATPDPAPVVFDLSDADPRTTPAYRVLLDAAASAAPDDGATFVLDGVDDVGLPPALRRLATRRGTASSAVVATAGRSALARRSLDVDALFARVPDRVYLRTSDPTTLDAARSRLDGATTDLPGRDDREATVLTGGDVTTGTVRRLTDPGTEFGRR